MKDLKSKIEQESIELIIWDFDGVIFDLEWEYEGTSQDLLTEIYEVINKIDETIIKDKDEFITRQFPYPEINEVGLKYGRETQSILKSIFGRKESSALHKAVPNEAVIDFIKSSTLSQSIWSNNLSSTIEYLLKQADIDTKIGQIASFDKVIQAKPHVEGFEIIRSEYPEIDKGNILFVGDSLRSDKVAAENTGINFYHYLKS